ncbi:MAG TPA: GNAT family N-acetyltransferase [Ktedonobacteraceae bacterium]|nr:GNAT family N-acetyltransferase [Ktedonobacteraceae bacterium]
MYPPIRLFTPDDYVMLNKLSNTLYPDYAITVDETRFLDQHVGADGSHQRWVMEDNESLIATCEYSQFLEGGRAGEFGGNVMVHPAFQRRGIGTHMVHHLLTALQSLNAVSLRNRVREDMLAGRRFLEKQGFSETKRSWESLIDAQHFSRACFASVEAAVRAQGIEITIAPTLTDDPERDQKLYALYCELSQDVPGLARGKLMSYYAFMDYVLNGSLSLPDAFFVALHNGEYIGMSFLQASRQDDTLYTGLTGVKRAYRRHGIALVLKLHAIAYAQAHNHQQIRTWNDTTNMAILSVNERLGFVKQLAWITYMKQFQFPQC